MKQYFQVQHVVDAFTTGKIQQKQLNNFLVPMGSGKSTVIKELIKQQPSALVLYPYKTSKADFTSTDTFPDFKPNQSYFTDFVSQMFKATAAKASYKDADTFMRMYAKQVFSYIKEQEHVVVLLDESDFFMIQAQAVQFSGIVQGMTDGESFNIFADMLTYVTLRAIADATTLIGFSASTFKLPTRVVGMSLYVDTFINNIKPDIKPNIEVTEIVLINPDDHDTGNLNTALMEVCTGKTLVYQSKWKKFIVDTFATGSIQWLIREENFPKVYTDAGLTMSYGIALNNIKANTVLDMSHQESQLNDDKFKEYDYLGIGVSSSRAVSLINNYDNASIIVYDETITANALQILGRFRNSPTKVYWITTKTASEFESIAMASDVFFSQYVGKITDGNGMSIKDILGVSGVASQKGQFVGKSVGKSVGKAVGKAVGQAISAKTKAKNESFIAYMLQTNKPNWKDYSLAYPDGLSRASFFSKLKEYTV